MVATIWQLDSELFLERSAEQGIFAGCGIETYAAAILMEIICGDADCKSADDDLQCGMVSWRVQAQASFLGGNVSLTPPPSHICRLPVQSCLLGMEDRWISNACSGSCNHIRVLLLLLDEVYMKLFKRCSTLA